MATTKKKKLSKAAKRRRARARRRRRIALTCIAVALIAAAVIFIPGIFKKNDIVADQNVEADAVIPTETAEPVAVSEAEASEVTVEPTAEPTVEPTKAPTAEPAATAYAGPTPEPAREPAYITITATGDVALGSGDIKNANDFPKYYEQYGYTYFFENVREYFSEDDITIVNLEGPLTTATSKRSGRTFNFKGDPEYVQILTYGSVELCNIANNHILDYKEAGAEETIKVLQDAGIGVSGGMDNNEIEYYTDVNGYTVGSVGFTEWNFDKSYILETVQSAAKKCDLLIVSMHWNTEGHKTLTNYCIKMSEAMIDAGADIVIGNHTHSLGEIRKYNGKYIINSLGNFCFGGNDILWNYETDVFRQRFLLTEDENGVTVTDAGIDLKPALNYTTGERKNNNFKPGWPDDELAVTILETVGGYSSHLDMNEVYWLPQSYVAQHDLVSKFGGSVVADVSAAEAAQSVSSVTPEVTESEDTESEES